MDKMQQVKEVYNNLTACTQCDSCVYHQLRRYIEEVGFDEFHRQLIMGLLPQDIGYIFNMKVDSLARAK